MEPFAGPPVPVPDRCERLVSPKALAKILAAFGIQSRTRGGTVTRHDLRKTFISHLIVRLGLDPVRVSKIAGQTNVSVTLNIYAEEFDKSMHRDDLIAQINRAGFGAVEGVLTSC